MDTYPSIQSPPFRAKELISSIELSQATTFHERMLADDAARGIRQNLVQDVGEPQQVVSGRMQHLAPPPLLVCPSDAIQVIQKRQHRLG